MVWRFASPASLDQSRMWRSSCRLLRRIRKIGFIPKFPTIRTEIIGVGSANLFALSDYNGSAGKDTELRTSVAILIFRHISASADRAASACPA